LAVLTFVVVASGFAARVAGAESGTERRGPLFRVAYAGGPGCPSPEVFLRELHKRSVDAVFVAANRDATDFTAEAREVAGGAQGWLRARGADGRETTREVSGSSCQEVVGALALVTVLSIEPRTAGAPRSDAIVPPSSASPPGSNASPRGSPVSPPPPTADARPAPVVSDRSVPSGSREHGPRPKWDAGAVAMLTTGLGVESVFAGAVFLGVNDVAPWLASVRVSAGRTAEAERSAIWGTLRTELVYAGLEGCPVRLPRSQPLAVLPCAGIDVGRLRIEGEVTEPGGTSRSARKLWVDVPVSVRAEYLPVEALVLEVRAALLVPLTHYDLQLVDPTTVEYSMPPVAGAVGVGAALRFH